MNSRQLILAFLFTLTAPVFARDNTDRLTMNNGDSMTCEIKGLDGGVLYVSFDYIDGTAFVDWSKVARVESTRLFVVKTEDGSVYTGALKTAEIGAGRPVQIHVLQPPELVFTVERSQIVQMVATSDKFWERFNGGISLGTIYYKGNESTQYSLAESARLEEARNVKAPWRKWGPYLSERQWGTVREDYSQDGNAWRGMAALVNEGRLRRILTRMLDEKEFLSPYGIRALSRYHAEHPFVVHVQGQEYRVIIFLRAQTQACSEATLTGLVRYGCRSCCRSIFTTATTSKSSVRPVQAS